MTAKRFISRADYDWWFVKDTTGKFKGKYDDWMGDEEVIDLLNALHEENQYLQTRIQMLEGVMNTQHYYQKIADNRTDEVFQIKQTIIEAYNNERTMIGKSVLKQLMEQIQ